MKTHLENLNWRYATKRFDENKKISAEDLSALKEAVRLSASSYGLQPYQVLVIEDEKTKEKLRAAAFNQPQLTEASQVFVFASYTEVKEEYIQDYMKNVAETRGMDLSELDQFAEMIKGASMSLPKDQQAVWTAKQTYIALGFLLNAAATLKIDTCPMEGFNAEEFDEILGLKEKGLTTAVIATAGYRSEEDITQNYKKVRKSNEDLFINI
ncbi:MULTISPECIES: NAD(P)H-dependent oxidoreductase [Mesonia]|uniref:NAD(P)H nitroreductase n=1 Tax=Mesonia oceanica TaxID=2687242 RepID=A0AC61Y9I2_9FLAO|nr:MULTISPECIES: NAD(P)H-dependent oxidoreductase [Mesonia]MAN27907.1 NAD(P)H-dependent oxidoreductase [Mesonia sp.]MAQ41086.1 NAD(P)H-dependent oxidoreductase [Mesonia sp.]VVV01182.1 Putative NAD(P)H nitroreductase [Mesonia oceanica]|tara:strand:+ start:64656 stop:65288 length:633 start_codon:yes stop_codon:yes gene_type:complete